MHQFFPLFSKLSLSFPVCPLFLSDMMVDLSLFSYVLPQELHYNVIEFSLKVVDYGCQGNKENLKHLWKQRNA
jgi:hypothetical protein